MFCVDGRCCNEACTEEGFICDQFGREGECLPVAQTPALSDLGKLVGLAVLLLIAAIGLWRSRPER